mgnify:CR=1 FL=1
MRILLLTPADSDFPYAGNALLRKTVDKIGCEDLLWCGLSGCNKWKAPASYKRMSVPARSVHWRLRGTMAGYFHAREINARLQARQIARSISGFKPSLIWVLAEDEAVNVAYFLQRRLGIPLHLTFHDAPEVYFRFFSSYSPLAMSLYLGRLKCLFNAASSFDAVTKELCDHVEKTFSSVKHIPSVVFSPSVPREWLQPAPADRDFTPDSVKRIGFCGSMRVSREQWAQFMGLLSRLNCKVELLAYTDRDFFPEVTIPANVTLRVEKYVPSERELINCLRSAGIHGFYLGVWKDKEKELFWRTSLSSKISTYAAAGAPLIVDAAADSLVWKLVSKYNAGIRVGTGNDDDDVRQLSSVCFDPYSWDSYAQGLSRLSVKELDLDNQLIKLLDCFKRTVDRAGEQHVCSRNI